MTNPAQTGIGLPLCREIARSAIASSIPREDETTAKLRVCLLDFLSCALESRDLPISGQAIRYVSMESGDAPVLFTPHRVPVPQAAFANAVLGHGLVREDMHAGSVSHMGIVIMPALLALAARRPVSGSTFIKAAVLGYEAGGRFGRSLIDADFARFFRPTGFSGPVAGAIAGAALLGLDEDETTSALSLAVNTLSGLNEWPATGSDEMFFQAGFAARNAVTSVELARLGARSSERALDGRAGLFAAYRPSASIPPIVLFPDDTPEILTVYNKPVPACNYAQTPCQAMLALARDGSLHPEDVQSISVRGTRAMKLYPGCDYAGPFETILQAKMSIHFGVAAALVHGGVTEENYRRLDDPRIMRLARRVSVAEGTEFNAAYPARQGASVELTLTDGSTRVRSLPDVVPATAEAVRDRFMDAASKALGAAAAADLDDAVARLGTLEDVSILSAMTQR